ncbi:hypothetical protein Tco_0564321 [Tanacetum coccineum]
MNRRTRCWCRWGAADAYGDEGWRCDDGYGEVKERQTGVVCGVQKFGVSTLLNVPEILARMPLKRTVTTTTPMTGAQNRVSFSISVVFDDSHQRGLWMQVPNLTDGSTKEYPRPNSSYR